MKANAIGAIASESLINRHVNLVVVSSGYESRARSMAERFSEHFSSKDTRRLVWAFDQHRTLDVRLKNDRTMDALRYREYVLGEGALVRAETLFSEALAGAPSGEITAVIDISSMTRTWYGGIIRALARHKRKDNVRSIFYYSPAAWKESRIAAVPNEVLGPVPGFASCALPNKPTALVLGLGIDEDRALGLNEHLDPRITMCFRASPGSDVRFDNAVVKANRGLLDTLDDNCVFTFDLYDPFGTYKTIESVCHGLSRQYRVVSASLGPKIFGLYSFLLHTNMPEISVWRVSPAHKQPPQDHTTSGRAAMLEVIWEPMDKQLERARD